MQGGSADAYEPDFRANINNFANGPVRNRPCRDTFCLLILLMMIIGLGAIAYKSYRNLNVINTEIVTEAGDRMLGRGFQRHIERDFGKSLSRAFQKRQLTRSIGLIVVMGLISVAVSFLFLLLLQKFTRGVIYVSLVLSCLLLLASVIWLLIARNYLGALLLGVLLALLACMFWTLRTQLDAVIVIIRLTTEFMFQNISVYTIPLIIGLFSVIVSTIVSLGAASTLTLLKYGKSTGPVSAQYFGLSAVIYIFFAIFFYYVIVYLVASSVANWFYMQGSCAGCAGCPSVINHLGSFTFASMLIVILKILRAIVDQGMRDAASYISCMCYCMIQCCLSCIEGLIQTLNNLAVIVMSVTGQSYLDSAKTAAVIFYSQIQLFALLSTVNSAIIYSGIIFTIVVPAVLAYFISLSFLQTPVFVLITTVLVSFPIAMLFLSTLMEAMNSLFVFYALEMKLVQYGIKPPPVNPLNLQTADQLSQVDLSRYNPKEIMSIGYPIVEAYAR